MKNAQISVVTRDGREVKIDDFYKFEMLPAGAIRGIVNVSQVDWVAYWSLLAKQCRTV
jgi:hypothetical protein